jgi:putative molybdopterin biosynthesis protein
VRLANGDAVPAFKGSGEITSLAEADGYIEIPPQTETLEEGTIVEIVLF